MEIVKLSAGRDEGKAFTADELAKLIKSTDSENREVSLFTVIKDPLSVHWVKCDRAFRMDDRLVLVGHESATTETTSAFSEFYQELVKTAPYIPTLKGGALRRKW